MKIRPYIRITLGALLLVGLSTVGIPASAQSASAATPDVPADPSSAMATVTITPQIDTTSVIKNPAMGWQLYVEEFGEPLVSATSYWDEVGPYSEDATTLYLRLPWSRFEPTEGHYAWNDDANYKALIKGALDRGMHLAFRIVVDSQDVHMQATPQFVFDAGAKSYSTASNAQFHTPDLTDPIFRQKYAAFFAAFAAEYNDPSVTAYVDGFGLGFWGEMNSPKGLNASNADETLLWFSDLYSSKLDKVLIDINYPPGGFTKSTVDSMIASNKYAVRRDSLGSPQWFSQGAKDQVAAEFPAAAVFGENCYQSFTTRPTACDAEFNKPSTTGMLQRVVDDAKYIHANTLDLRWPEDVYTWVHDNPSLVQDFAINGGYRLALTSANWPTSLTVGSTFALKQTWSNSGVGRLPNNLGGWNGKYRVAYALLDSSDTVVSRWVDTVDDPGSWLKGSSSTSTVQPSFGVVDPGNYKLAYAIVDTSMGNDPAIALADADTTVNGWHVLGDSIHVNAAPVAPEITSDVFPAATAGSAYTFTVTASGTPAPEFSVSSGALPAGLTLNPETGVVSGTPTAAGDSTFVIVASNGVGDDASASYTLDVGAAAVVPVNSIHPAMTATHSNLADTGSNPVPAGILAVLAALAGACALVTRRRITRQR